MTTATSTVSAPRRRRAQWPVPAGLILLSLIPVIAGAARMTELTGGAAITPQNARFFASPVPVVTHIVSVTIYCLLGAFQFVPSLRGPARLAPHRRACPGARRPARRTVRSVDGGLLPAPCR